MTIPLSEWPDEEKPRERMLAKGAKALSDVELIAIFLNTGCRGVSVVDLARSLLNEVGGIYALGKFSVWELSQLNGMGHAKAIRLLAACELGRRRERKPIRQEPIIRSVRDAGKLIASRLRDVGKECFFALYLDKKHRVVDEAFISMGGLDQAPVHPRELLRPALACSASAIIIAHNHPSGDPTPSMQDRALTQRLDHAAWLMGINLLDHIIIGDGENISFAEKGYLEKDKNVNRLTKSQTIGPRRAE
ncbi:DNA repair protein RadC [bacterium]|nr:DNA repair protein RadC [bacterium]